MAYRADVRSGLPRAGDDKVSSIDRDELDMLHRRADYGGTALDRIASRFPQLDDLLSAHKVVSERVGEEVEDNLKTALRGSYEALNSWLEAIMREARYWRRGSWKNGVVDCAPPIVRPDEFKAPMAAKGEARKAKP